MPHRSFRSRNFNSGKKHTHNPVFLRAKSNKSNRKGMHYYKMITNNNFNPLSTVEFFFVNKLLIFDCLFSLYEVTMTEQIPDKKGDSPEV